jgi:hypothetical protein
MYSPACADPESSNTVQGAAQSDDPGCAPREAPQLPGVRKSIGTSHELERPPTTEELTWLTQDAVTYFTTPYARYTLLSAEPSQSFQNFASVLRSNLLSNWGAYAGHVETLHSSEAQTASSSAAGLECVELEFGRMVVRAWNLNPITHNQDYWQRDLQTIADNFAQAMGEVHGEYTRVHQPREVVHVRWAPMRAYLFAHGRTIESEIELTDGPTREPRIIEEPCAPENSPTVPLLLVRAEDETLVPVDLSWLPNAR